MMRRFYFLGWLLIGVQIAGCSTYRAVSLPLNLDQPASVTIESETVPEGLSHLSTGDKVRVTLESGEEIKGRVLWLSSRELGLTHGDHTRAEKEPPVCVDVNNIAAVEKKVHSAGKSWGLAGIILVGSVGLLAAAIAAGGGINVNFGS